MPKVNMSEIEYHAHPAIGSTGLKKVLRSVAHWLWDKENPIEQTKALKFGTAFHMAALEPNKFKETCIVIPEFSGSGSRAAKDQWLVQNHGKTIVSDNDMTTIKGMLKSLSAHNMASKLLADGAAESSYFWNDSETGVECKCRPDFLRGGKIIADIKTTQDASLNEFQRTIGNYKYHLSAAHYLDGVSAVLGESYKTFLLIAVEKDPPYAVQVFDLDEASLDKGRELCARALRKIKTYQANGVAEAYSQDIVPINLLPWNWAE